MSEPFTPTTLRTERFFRYREEFTLFGDKVRVEWTSPTGSGVVELPLRFLDPTWASHKRSASPKYLVYALFLALGGAGMALAAWRSRDPLPDVFGVFVVAGAMLVGSGWALWRWRKSGFDVMVFSSLHSGIGNLVVYRDRNKELEALQFVDAVSERIRLFALTKPEG